MVLPLHRYFTPAMRHAPHSFEYANAAARTAATGFTADDVGRWALQLDNGSFWRLTDDSPVTWVQITGSGVGGAVTSVNGNTGVVVLDPDDLDDTSTTNKFFTDERAQDAVGTVLSDAGDIDFTYDDATPAISATVKTNAITYAKLQDISATNRILGRVTSGAGDAEELTPANVRSIINVEDGADVTDATNVDAAGAVMVADTSTVGFGFVIDEDNMASDSATKAPTQQSVKAYVDMVATGLDFKSSARLATAAALAANTRVGNVLTADANGALDTIDGVAPQVGDRIVVKNEATGANNGIYAVTDLGSGGTPWILTRTADADTSADVTAGLYLYVAEGTVNGNKSWVLTTDDPITLNTTALSFTEFSGGGSSYDDEMAQDAVGTILSDAGDIDFTYDDATPAISAAVKNNTVTYAKMQDVSATNRILGRITAGAGDPEELTPTNVRTMINVEDGADVTDATNVAAAGATMNADPRSITFQFGDGTNVIASTEEPQEYHIPVAMTIVGWRARAKQSGSIVWALSLALSGSTSYTTITSAAGTADADRPQLSSEQEEESNDVSGWQDVTLPADSWLRATINGSPTSVTRAQLAIVATKD